MAPLLSRGLALYPLQQMSSFATSYLIRMRGPTITLNKLYITCQAIEKIYEHTISSRPLELAEKTLNVPDDQDMAPSSSIMQNKLLIEFINHIIQSNPHFGDNILNATENRKNKIFNIAMDKLRSEGVVSSYGSINLPASEYTFK